VRGRARKGAEMAQNFSGALKIMDLDDFIAPAQVSGAEVATHRHRHRQTARCASQAACVCVSLCATMCVSVFLCFCVSAFLCLCGSVALSPSLSLSFCGSVALWLCGSVRLSRPHGVVALHS
jgi:hypothetical protein